MDNIKKCGICKIRGTIKCEQCPNPTFFCSRGHLFTHKNKYHRAMSANAINRKVPQMQSPNYVNSQYSQILPRSPSTSSTQVQKEFSNQNVDMRQLFEHLQNTKKEIIIKMNNQKYKEAIDLINKALGLSRKFYQEDHPFNIELIFSIAECHFNLSNLEETKNNLESLIMLTENIQSPNTNSVFRHKAQMLLGAIALNLGEFNIALKAYTQCEEELPRICKEPELNVKLSAVYLNLGICYIYLANPNIAEKYLKKGLNQTEGILGNNTIHKLNADLFENLGLLYEQSFKFKESMVYYKKSLKLKFNLYGDNHDEVLELQYKISSVYLSLKQYKEAEEILSAMIEVVIKEKINYATQEVLYRYAAYFYTYGVILIKVNKTNMAKFYLLKSRDILNGFLMKDDPLFSNISNLVKLCDSGKKR